MVAGSGIRSLENLTTLAVLDQLACLTASISSSGSLYIAGVVLAGFNILLALGIGSVMVAGSGIRSLENLTTLAVLDQLACLAASISSFSSLNIASLVLAGFFCAALTLAINIIVLLDGSIFILDIDHIPANSATILIRNLATLDASCFIYSRNFRFITNFMTRSFFASSLGFAFVLLTDFNPRFVRGAGNILFINSFDIASSTAVAASAVRGIGFCHCSHGQDADQHDQSQQDCE
jgi:hypothetical protein